MAFVSAKKLKLAIRQSDQRLAPFCEQRKQAIEEFKGRFYGDTAIGKRPINLVNRQLSILAAHLTAGNPINDVRSDRLEFRAKALLLQLALGHLDQELDRARISRRMLIDGLVSPCMFARVGLRAGQETVTIEGHNYDRGQPYYLPISLDDMIYDPVARCDDEAFMMGHRYRVNRDRLLETGIFGQEYQDLIANLPAVAMVARDDRASESTTPGASDEDSYLTGDMVELADVALYDDDMVYLATVPWGEQTPDEYLNLAPWQGPERGPFVKREFTVVPDSPFGVPPVAQAREQAEIINEAVVKLTELVRNLKTIIGYKPGYHDTADEVEKAKDGDKVAVEDPQKDITTLQFGLIPPGLDQFLGFMMQLWNQQTGGIQVLGGETGGADTATEYAGMSSAASLLVGDLAREHESFETEVTKRLAFYLRTDPFIKLPLVHRLRGGELIQVTYTPDMMEDEHGDFTYRIRSLSMRAETQDPIIRQRRLIEMIVAFGQVAQVSVATGNLIDFAGTVRVLAREFGIEEADEIIGDPMFAALKQAMYTQVPGEMMGAPGGGPSPFGGMRQGAGRGVPSSGRRQTTVGGSLAGSIGRAVRNPGA